MLGFITKLFSSNKKECTFSNWMPRSERNTQKNFAEFSGPDQNNAVVENVSGITSQSKIAMVSGKGSGNCYYVDA